MLLPVFGLILAGCISDDITTSPDDVLSFSVEKVSFDTVITETGTPTARLLVYNRAKKGVNISAIGFKDPDTRFRLNVDGQTGSNFHDVEIRGGDSIYVFIECDPPKSPTSEPQLIEDQLQFVTNGVLQEVPVEAYGQNVTRLKAVTLEGDMTMTDEQPYVIYDSLVVAPGTRLRIDPGARLLFHDNAKLVVYGTLEAVGTKEKKIDMRGDRLDNVLKDVSYDIMAGQWHGVRIARQSFDNRLEYVNMRSTRVGLDIDSCADLSRQKLLLVNSWLHNSQYNALTSRHARVDAYGCVFSEAANAAVSLSGGSHRFVHCTIANYYLFAAISSAALSLYHCLPADGMPDVPLMNASFENCIIYGLGGDINEGTLDDSDVYMRNVLFKSSGEDDSHFLSCVWGEDPLYYTVREDYIFDYRLRPESPAIGRGNSSFVTDLCRFDWYGMDRLATGTPDLGAYVFTEPKEEDNTQE